MPVPPIPKPVLALFCAPLCALALSACASTVATTSFKGAEHEVAQVLANLQADATAAEQKKICVNDLAAAVVAHLGGTKRCETAIKNQVAEIDNLDVSVKSVRIAASGVTATAYVTSTSSGKTHSAAVSLVKEGNAWRISGVS